jgi:hypothetical protein
MISRTPACLAGILGGLCWVARYVADRFDLVAASGQGGAALRWAGLTWLVIAVISAGAGLARRAELWLRLLIGISVLLLASVVLSLLYPVTGRLLGDAVFGGAAVLVAAVVWIRGSGRGRGGTHAAHAAD